MRLTLKIICVACATLLGELKWGLNFHEINGAIMFEDACITI